MKQSRAAALPVPPQPPSAGLQWTQGLEMPAWNPGDGSPTRIHDRQACALRTGYLRDQTGY